MLRDFFLGALFATGIQLGGFSFTIKYLHKLLPSHISFPIIVSLTFLQIVGRVFVKNVNETLKEFNLDVKHTQFETAEKLKKVDSSERTDRSEKTDSVQVPRPRTVPETLTSSFDASPPDFSGCSTCDLDSRCEKKSSESLKDE
jgi:hypothetical protein